MTSWDSVLAGMTSVPEEAILEALFYDNLRNAHALKEEIAHYDRARRGTEEHTYKFLVESVRRYLERQRHASNRRAVAKALGGNSSNSAPAAPAEGGQNKNQKGGGKQRDGSQSSRASPVADKVCFEFQRSGNCKYGNKCKYKHVRDAAPAAGRGRSSSSSKSPKKKGKGKSKGS